jgi:hypothetical protein
MYSNLVTDPKTPECYDPVLVPLGYCDPEWR